LPAQTAGAGGSRTEGGRQTKNWKPLTKAAEPAQRRTNPRPTAEEKPVDLSKADEKLSSLLERKP